MKEREVISRGLETVPGPPGLSLGGWEGVVSPGHPCQSSSREERNGLHWKKRGLLLAYTAQPLG